LSELLEAGMLALHCDQPNGYYDAVLAIPNKQMVLPDFPAGAYKLMLDSWRNGGELLALADVPVAVNKKRRTGERPLVFCLLPAAAAPPPAHPLAVLDDAADADDLLLEEAEMEDEWPEAEEPDAPLVFPALPLPPSLDGAAPPPPSPAGLSAAGVALWHEAYGVNVPKSMLGQIISVDAHCGASEYVRKRISCNFHPQCNKYRNCSFNRSFGSLEVVGFLGCWLQSGRNYDNKREHVAYKPTNADVEGFLQQHGLLAAAI
jgi:hypothetical protein